MRGVSEMTQIKQRSSIGPRCIVSMVITIITVSGCGGSNVAAPKTGYSLRRVYQGAEKPQPWSTGRKISQSRKRGTSGHFSESLVFELTIPRAGTRSLALGLEKAVVTEAERHQLEFDVRPVVKSKGAESFTVACENDYWSCVVSGLIREKRTLPRGLVCVLVELSYRESKL